MFVAVIIGEPLEPEMVRAVRNAWGGGDAVWLAPDRAAEFPISQRPPNFGEVREELSRGGIDMAIVPAGGRRKRMLLADMDSTMIGQECIDELAASAGVGEKVSGITARAMSGELDFEGALLERVALLAGLDQGAIGTVLNERITLARGARTLVATMKRHGAHTALVSGGFVQFSEAIARALGFDEHRANRLLVAEGRLTGDVARPILGRDAKVQALEDIAAARGLSRDDVLAVGDGANDLDMIKRAGLGVALHAKPVVAAEAPIRIDHADLTALLYLQGYSEDEFAMS